MHPKVLSLGLPQPPCPCPCPSSPGPLAVPPFTAGAESSRVTHSTSCPPYVTHAAWMAILGTGMICAMPPPPKKTPLTYLSANVASPIPSSSSLHDSDKRDLGNRTERVMLSPAAVICSLAENMQIFSGSSGKHVVQLVSDALGLAPLSMTHLSQRANKVPVIYFIGQISWPHILLQGKLWHWKTGTFRLVGLIRWPNVPQGERKGKPVLFSKHTQNSPRNYSTGAF